MMVRTDIPEAPWWVVDSDDRRRSRLNTINHLLSTVPCTRGEAPRLELPDRPPAAGYERPPRDTQRLVPDHAATLLP